MRRWYMQKHCSWGNSIEWFDYARRRITGFLTPLPKVGDKMYAEMKDGRFTVFDVVVVDRFKDPKDQFFATLKDERIITREEAEKEMAL